MSKTPDFCPACGELLHKKRVLKAHRLYFAVIEAAFLNWPEPHDFRPVDDEHLRAWLQCEANHCFVIAERLSQDDGDVARMVEFHTKIIAHMQLTGARHVFFERGRNYIVAKIARSIAWADLDERDFAPVRQTVFEIIETTLRVKIEDLQNHARHNVKHTLIVSRRLGRRAGRGQQQGQAADGSA